MKSREYTNLLTGDEGIKEAQNWQGCRGYSEILILKN